MTTATLKSILSGVGGSLILALFCMTFLTPDRVLIILPLFIAFNGAMTGYKLVEELGNRIQGRFVFPFVMGIGMGAAVFAAVHAAGKMMHTQAYLTITDLGIYTLISGVTSYLGARLAARYFNL